MNRVSPTRRLAAPAGLVVVLTLTACGTPPAPGTSTLPTSQAAPPVTSVWPSTVETPSEGASGAGTTWATTSASASGTTASSKPPVKRTCPTPPSTFVRKAPGSGKTVALTFDDGPAPADVQIAAVLERYGVHATFFETGLHANDDPGTVRMLAAKGHLIADHSYDHEYPADVPGGWTTSYLRGQLDRTDSVLQAVSGKSICYFRPPGGFTDNVLTAAGAEGLTSVMWTVDSLDWKQPVITADSVVATIVANATKVVGQDHPIVLMHSGKASHEPDSKVTAYRGNTVAALPAIIEWYQSHGYRFVRMDGTA